ncbi:hypothetical protein RclHR1_05510004 [Rhizophagus clarus]|uniref:MIR domain-containing protein n=1 Tax=Rhizophagus clarus TaxID=94130 RepID=A0A2Z6RTD6_9GLOM|nr:hypothetical protein RclHR1_05510004 [Rhizophagus clarus]GES94988.1 hypothetical protein GLOIN_2v1543999 [Rhizophagus clarus]
MDHPKYDGNIHPDEWINDIQKYDSFWKARYSINTAISLIDPIIKLPTGIDNYEKLRNALKEDVSFKIFKNTNKRKLQSLKYIPERKGGDTSKFISTFRKLCYNAELNEIEEQKKYLFKSLPNNHFDYISNEFYEKMKNVNSINELAEEFENIVLEESNLIRNESIVALKHVATGKYLCSKSNLHYTTGSKNQLVFVGSSEPGPNSLWKITFSKELATYTDSTSITLQHAQSNLFLGLSYYSRYDGYRYLCCYHKSPSTNHTEVNCGGNDYTWNFKHSKLENHQGYLKSNNIINLGIKRVYDYNGDNTQNGPVEFLRSHDIQFTIGDDTFQEVVCHNERLGGNDEWCIELIHEVKVF